MTKNYVIFIALFCATQTTQAAEHKPPTKDKNQPKKGSLMRRPSSAAEPSSTAQPPLTPSPEMPASFFVVPVRKADTTKPVWLQTRNPRYPLGSSTNLLLAAQPLAAQPTPAPENTEEHAQALEFYKKSKDLLAQLQAVGAYLVQEARLKEKELEALLEAKQETRPVLFLSWMKDFYETLVEKQTMHTLQEAKKAKQAARRAEIARSRSALGIATTGVLFIDEGSKPGSLSVSPPTELAEVMSSFQPIPHKDDRTEKPFEDKIAKEHVAFLISEFHATSENPEEQNHIRMRLKKFLAIHPDLTTEITDEITKSVSF